MSHRIVQTCPDRSGARWEQILPAPDSAAATAAHVRLGNARRPDPVRGFGGAFTESAAWVWSLLSAQRQQEVLEACFCPEQGLGYTLGRTHMNSCDFSLGNYSAVETPGDTKLWSFFCEQEPKYLWPFMKAAQQYLGESIPLLLSPWSPPAWMKTNNSMNNGGSLKPEYRDAWAKYFCRYIRELQDKGFHVFGITVQNEPEATQTWDSCRYTSEEEALFIRDYLGPELEKQGLADIALYCWDHNRDLLAERVDAIMSNPDTARYVAGAAIHWYAEGHFDQVEAVKAAHPDLEIIFSEGCIEGGVKLGQWDRAERYARNMIHDLNTGVSRWLDWNMILDLQGGPNHVGNFCDAPLIADTDTDTVYYQPSYAAIGHFSRYVKSGAVCLHTDVQGASPDLDIAAFENPDGTRVVVICNATENDVCVQVNSGSGGATLATATTAHSLTTCILDPAQHTQGA